MAHLVQSILICLILAILLGFVLGWVSRALFANARNGRGGKAASTRAEENKPVKEIQHATKRHDFIFIDR
jgi:hypothetical protein